MENPASDPLATLALADPALSDAISAGLGKRYSPLPPAVVGDLVDFVLHCISVEISFGEAVARALSLLLEDADPERLLRFRRLVAEAADIGPALGRLMALHAGPVLRLNSTGFLHKFLSTVAVMRRKGVQTLFDPLACLSGHLLAAGDIPAAEAFLDLMETTFATDLSYGLTRYFAHSLPGAVAAMGREGWPLRIRQITRVMAADTGLVEPFLEGLSRGLSHLSPEELETFVSRGLGRAAENPAAGRTFLSLSSGLARLTLETLQTTATLDTEKPRLEQYLHARTGAPVPVRPLSDLPEGTWASGESLPLVCTDGRSLYLADLLDRHDSRNENRALYRTLCRLESAVMEFGTFDFDLERLKSFCPDLPGTPRPAGPGVPDLVRFFTLFPCPALAGDLFTVFEHGRLHTLSAARYPGLVRRMRPVLEKEIPGCFGSSPTDLRALLYAAILLGPEKAATVLNLPGIPEIVGILCRRSRTLFDRSPASESSARLVLETYPNIAPGDCDPSPPFTVPFGRKILPKLFHDTFRHLEPLVDRIRAELEKQGRKSFRSDIRKELIQTDGRLSTENLRAILSAASSPRDTARDNTAHLYGRLSESLPELFQPTSSPSGTSRDEGTPVFWYREWNHATGDYLDRHVRLVEHRPPAHAEDLFDTVLDRHRGMVINIRRAFELIRPQGLRLLRHWPDGDDIDLPALMASLTDRKAGHPPSDRIYLKRAKETRDVAVLLLVDLSGSTRNTVPGTGKTVLAVEREAIVLFCEALGVVGDEYAVAGFSGRGRLQVDYYRYKDFDNPVTRSVRRRISGMTPQRSTRTGAALRHGTRVLSRRPSRVRLLILLSDGFPNDTGYKRDHAVSDVQKAISEAAAGGVHVRPITVNLSADKGLDDLYGRLHHNVISDIRELPDTLWRIYCALTK